MFCQARKAASKVKRICSTSAPVERADVIVVGAGPAGSIASLVLARAGMRVTMLESRAVPREKVCGDALIPDALELLARVVVAFIDGLASHPRGDDSRDVRVTFDVFWLSLLSLAE